MEITIRELDRRVVGWVNPALEHAENRIPFKENWAVNKLSHALLLVLLYLAFVALSFFFLYDAKAEKIKKDAADRVKRKKTKLTVSQKCSKQPFVFVSMCVYNLIQVMLCAYMVREAILGATEREFGLVCNEFDVSGGNRRIANVLHVFYLSKILDFADTVFMVAKGNWRQVSFLHVYHHSSIFMVYWLILNSGYDGDIYVTIVLNGFIHFVMYLYYFVTTLNVRVPVTIKKMVTNMQLIQFLCMIAQSLVALLSTEACPYPRNLFWIYLIYIISMFALFSNFKRKTYDARKKRLPKGDERMHEPVSS